MRRAGVWALKNLVYMADVDVKSAVVQQLTFPRLFRYRLSLALSLCALMLASPQPVFGRRRARARAGPQPDPQPGLCARPC
jgi:hypothetical protein